MRGSDVLVVEDEPNLREFVARVLADSGFSVRTAANGLHALELIDQARPDAVVLDLTLPGIDGFEVLERLRSDPANATVGVVVLSGRDDRESVERSLRLGANNYLLKPFSPWELAARLEATMESLGLGRGRTAESDSCARTTQDKRGPA